MPRYFFHFHDGTDQPDLTGTELASSKAARSAAVVFMGEKLKELQTAISGPRANGLSASSTRPKRIVCTIRVTGDQVTPRRA